mmetsp:Transcript_2002/g.7242  ORF Transcript_2002/g.7242 Transcript_2002/m.7242 type:complete len:460 (-) Transcript_2002:45-1424(-)
MAAPVLVALVQVWEALSATIVAMVAAAVLHYVFPASVIRGYACDRQGRVLQYRINALRVLLVCVCAYAALFALWWWVAVHSPEWLLSAPSSRKRSFHLLAKLCRNSVIYIATHYWSCIHAANILGLIMSLAFFIKGGRIPPAEQEVRRRALTVDMVRQHKQQQQQLRSRKNGSRIAVEPTPIAQLGRDTPSETRWLGSRLLQFYTGREFNPRWRWFDYKMFCYLWGAVLLEMILLNIAAYQYITEGYVTNRLLVYVCLFSWFVVDYMYHEHVHVFTYDLFAERTGFKIVWGCVCFYPYFYTVGAWPTAAIPLSEDVELFSLQVAAWAAVFLAGWVLSRGANNQKHQFKQDPDRAFFFGLVRPKSVVVLSKKSKQRTRLLCSGWWGYARHVNYLGEMLMAVGLALPGGEHSWLPWLYPLYYVLLLVPREREDNRLCQAKYGRAWREYCRVVPYRIIPYVY